MNWIKTSERLEAIRAFVHRWGNYHPDERFSIGEMLEDIGQRGMPLPRFEPWIGYALDDMQPPPHRRMSDGQGTRQEGR